MSGDALVEIVNANGNGGDGVVRKRRIGRRGTDTADVAGESLDLLRAELILLREENARLKVAEHRAPDLGSMLARARSLPTADFDRDSVDDATTRVFVEGLVIRESLLEICQGIERAMVAFEAKLRALQSATPQAPSTHETSNGYGHPGA
jgi:hypothetical protein